MQGKAIPSFVRHKIKIRMELLSQIGKELRLPKQTISKIVDIFVRRGNIEDNKGGNSIRSDSAC